MPTQFIDPPVIEGEADGTEFAKVLSQFAIQNSVSFINNEKAEQVVRLLPRSIGWWLAHSTPLEDGSLRGEIHRGIIVRAVKKPEYAGEAFGHSFTEPAHYDIYLKFEGAALADLADELGMEVKNG